MNRVFNKDAQGLVSDEKQADVRVTLADLEAARDAGHLTPAQYEEFVGALESIERVLTLLSADDRKDGPVLNFDVAPQF